MSKPSSLSPRVSQAQVLAAAMSPHQMRKEDISGEQKPLELNVIAK